MKQLPKKQIILRKYPCGKLNYSLNCYGHYYEYPKPQRIIGEVLGKEVDLIKYVYFPT